MTSQQGLQVLVHHKTGDDVARVAEHQGEQPNDAGELRLIGEGSDEAGKVDLRLLAGRRLEADLKGLGLVGRTGRGEEALHGRVGALVPAFADLSGEPDRTQVREGRDALAQVIKIRRQLAGASALTRATGRRLEATGDVLADGLGIAAGAAGDG